MEPNSVTAHMAATEVLQLVTRAQADPAFREKVLSELSHSQLAGAAELKRLVETPPAGLVPALSLPAGCEELTDSELETVAGGDETWGDTIRQAITTGTIKTATAVYEACVWVNNLFGGPAE